MEDLSGPVRYTSLAITSQGAGNMQSSNAGAFAPPGGRPVDPLPDRASQGDPALDVTDHARTVLEPGGPARDPSPWRRADGTEWVTVSPDISGGNARPGPWGQQ